MSDASSPCACACVCACPCPCPCPCTAIPWGIGTPGSVLLSLFPRHTPGANTRAARGRTCRQRQHTRRGSLSPLDTLSEVLRAIRLTGAVYFTIDGSAPWVAETPPGAVIAPHIGAGVEHVVNYHVVTAGAGGGGGGGGSALWSGAGGECRFPPGSPPAPSREARG